MTEGGFLLNKDAEKMRKSPNNENPHLFCVTKYSELLYMV